MVSQPESHDSKTGLVDYPYFDSQTRDQDRNVDAAQSFVHWVGVVNGAHGNWFTYTGLGNRLYCYNRPLFDMWRTLRRMGVIE